MITNIIKPAFILATIAFIATFTLSHINRITKPEIAKRLQMKKDDAYAAVLPASLGFVIVEKDKKAVVDGKDFFYTVATKTDSGQEIKAYAFETAKSGYSGVIRSIVAVDENMKLLGISIIQQSETPGLGARAKEIASSETFFRHFFGNGGQSTPVTTQSWFEAQFSGIDCTKKIGILRKGEYATAGDELKKELAEKNSVSAITGATITTKAVINGIAEGIERLKKALVAEKTSQAEVKTQ